MPPNFFTGAACLACTQPIKTQTGRRRHDPFCLLVRKGSRPSLTRLFSFPSSLRQLRGLRRSRSWDRQCVEGAWNRSWNRRSGCEAAERHALGGYRGGSLSACALDVGALIFLLILHIIGADNCPPLHNLRIKRADYSGRLEERQGRECRVRSFTHP